MRNFVRPIIVSKFFICLVSLSILTGLSPLPEMSSIGFSSDADIEIIPHCTTTFVTARDLTLHTLTNGVFSATNHQIPRNSHVTLLQTHGTSWAFIEWRLIRGWVQGNGLIDSNVCV